MVQMSITVWRRMQWYFFALFSFYSSRWFRDSAHSTGLLDLARGIISAGGDSHEEAIDLCGRKRTALDGCNAAVRGGKG